MGVWDNLKSKMGMGPPPPPPTLPQQLIQNATAAIEQHTPELTWKQRAIGFGICLGVGLLFSFLVSITGPPVSHNRAPSAPAAGRPLPPRPSARLRAPVRQLR
jgi:hypothetical protein